MTTEELSSEWLDEGDALTRDFAFADFKEAMAFTQKVGLIAEEMNHHPDIVIHDYKYVSLILRTHDAQSVTQKDRKLAGKIEEII